MSGTASAPRPKIIRDRDFGIRLTKACDGSSYCPPPNKGRLSWIKAQLFERFHETISVESVRKWLAGEMKPEANRLRQLAIILDVDESWLSLGIQPDLEPRARKVRNAMADGAVNVLAGFIQIAGGSPAFPEAGDARAEKQHIDLYAIIKGAQYAIHVALAHTDDNGLRFTLPTNHEDIFVIGVELIDGPGVKFYEIPSEVIVEHGEHRGGAVDLTVSSKASTLLRRITDFSKRI